MTKENEPTESERDWIRLSQALADAEWTLNHARATLQEAEDCLRQVRWWQHPLVWLKLWRNIRWLRRSIAL